MVRSVLQVKKLIRSFTSLRQIWFYGNMQDDYYYEYVFFYFRERWSEWNVSYFTAEKRVWKNF